MYCSPFFLRRRAGDEVIDNTKKGHPFTDVLISSRINFVME
jgi:hypothetical protein